MNDNENIFFVGVLQDLGMPYSSLYVDKENRQLYIFVRASDEDASNYFATPVTSDEVASYMSENLGLLNIFNKRNVWFVTINNNEEITIDKSIIKNFKPNERMKRMDIFDPELCEDDIWLETFLARINNNQPLEIS